MAGFAVLVSSDSTNQTLEKDFQTLLRMTASFKQLGIPSAQAKGMNCIAAKLDSSASVHPGIVRDDQTGSWLLAAGTVVALEGDNNPNTVLSRLLRGYIENGLKSLKAFDGHYAIVIYNGQEDSLSVISDPIGLFSIFYVRRGGQVLISSSALALATQTQSKPDILAVEHFLRTGRLDGDKTLWQDIKRLLGGTVLHANHRCAGQTEYWSPTFDEYTSRLPFDDALDQSAELLTKTFDRTLQREGKTWVDLTGGFDSRLAAMLVANTRVPFKVYCMGPEDHPDVQLSRKVSEEMRWDYVHTQLPEQWEPDQYSWFSTALGCGDARANLLRFAVTLRGFNERNTAIKTNVMGIGGENWRGYCWQIEKGNIGRTTKLNYAALLDNVFTPAIPLQVMRYDRTKEVRQELSDFIHQLCLKYSELPNTVQIDRFEICRDSGHGGAYLSAVASLDRSLAPLCFKAPVNFAISLNYHWKFPRHHIFVRTLLERENKILANLDTTTGGPAVPIRLTNIHRFWPLWKEITNRVVTLGSKKILGRTVQHRKIPHQTEYPLPAWRSAFYAFAQSEGMLNFNSMCTSGLYKRDEFNTFREYAALGQSHSGEFLDRVVSVEMAMRAVGSCVD